MAQFYHFQGGAVWLKIPLTMEMRRVYSSHINAVGYDEDRRELRVEFSNGSIVVYGDVPAETGGQVIAAPSIGEEIWRTVRGRHDHRYEHRAGKK